MVKKLSKRSLESILLESGKIAPGDLKKVLEKQINNGKRLEEILVEDNIITEKELLQLMESYLGIRYIDLSRITINTDAARTVSEALANKYNLIPIDIINNKIVVAMSNPLDLFAIDDVKFATGYEVEPVIASKKDINRIIERLYTKQNTEKAVEDLKNAYNPPKATKEPSSDSMDEVNNAPAVRLVNSMIMQAVKSRASDIHIEPYETHVKIRFRIDGQLQEVMRVDRQTLPAIITRIKIISNLNIAERRIPQDGRIMITVDSKDVDLRVSILPTAFGEKVVIRVLNRSNFLVPKQELGFSSEDMVVVDNMIKRPYGILLVTGPTGSGKSTTLYTLLNELNTVEKNIVTIEDPVEYVIEGINQVQVNVKAGLTFASGLRSILRQDPDIIMIGEIRDSETAEIAVRAAITGHLVLSTLHTNDAPSSIIRLLDMGIQPFLLSSSLIGTISQRLVRKICPRCKTEYEADMDEKSILGIPSEKTLKLYKGKGCSICNHTGYRSRVGVFEIMEFTKEHRKVLHKNIDEDELRGMSIKMGMKTLKTSCTELVLKGITTVDELIRIAII